MSSWKELDNDRMINKSVKGVSFIKRKVAHQQVPVSCPVCGFLIRDARDVKTWERYGCCQECTHTWAEPRRNEWDAGWRPDEKQIQEQRDKRSKRPSYLIEDSSYI